MGGVSPKGPAHSPLSSQIEKPHLSVNSIQEKMALEDAICGESLCAVTEAVCFGGGEGAIVALNSQSAFAAKLLPRTSHLQHLTLP